VASPFWYLGEDTRELPPPFFFLLFVRSKRTRCFSRSAPDMRQSTLGLPEDVGEIVASQPSFFLTSTEGNLTNEGTPPRRSDPGVAES